MKRKKKNLKKLIARIMLYTIFDVMWTSLMMYGFMQNTIY